MSARRVTSQRQMPTTWVIASKRLEQAATASPSRQPRPQGSRRSRTWPSAAPPNHRPSGYSGSRSSAATRISPAATTARPARPSASAGPAAPMARHRRRLGFNLGGDSRQFESTLEILMGRGAKPSDPSAYDAQQVLSRRCDRRLMRVHYLSFRASRRRSRNPGLNVRCPQPLSSRYSRQRLSSEDFDGRGSGASGPPSCE